ncbi:sporulation protein YqfD [Paenibacillus sambharensis]|uniref:Sporulation protein YqfD n=1 Tax=Paenibacillus sambharensis TaxID=1803190 RepID=A0A2W1LFU2_9BACL|nr:sporulation protein YqfD [Paenibacillus sambharensis]PZD93935.1 sporulation protein YqfD [Paenibacillus sambharensis]
MRLSWLDKMRGVVSVRIQGNGLENLMNAAAADGLQLLSLRRTSLDEAVCGLRLRDLFRIRPYLRRTGCRLRITGRHGLPFMLAKLERRKFFVAGMLLFFVGMYLLSSLVWRVEVKGNDRLAADLVLRAAREEGIYPFQWSFRLQPFDEVSKRLATKLPGTAWVGVQKHGTKVTIELVETTAPDAKPLMSPRHLIASEDAVITHIMAETGRPVVRKNTRVKKGDVLISGLLGDEEKEETVVAEGTVKGLVWHEYNIVSPLTRTVKVYTGERKVQWFAVVGGRALQVSGFGKAPFGQYEKVRQEQQAAWRGISLPFGRMKQSIMETRLEKRPVTKEEARADGLLQARAEILTKAGEDAVIRDENLLHEKTENGKVYMKVLFEVEQSITTEMPLVHIQGE